MKSTPSRSCGSFSIARLTSPWPRGKAFWRRSTATTARPSARRRLDVAGIHRHGDRLHRDGGRRQRGGRRGERDQCPHCAAGAVAHYRGRATPRLGHPHRALRGSHSRAVPHRRPVDGAGQPPAAVAGRHPLAGEDFGPAGHCRASPHPGRPHQDHHRREGIGPSRERHSHLARPVGGHADPRQGQHQGGPAAIGLLRRGLREAEKLDPAAQRDHFGHGADGLGKNHVVVCRAE